MRPTIERTATGSPLILFLTLRSTLALAQVEIADRYDAAPSSSTKAAALAARCVPGTTESSYQKMVKDAGTNSLVTTRLRPTNPRRRMLR
jgi:hypothetical protein